MFFKKMRCCAFLVVAFVFVAPAFAQTLAKVNGKVIQLARYEQQLKKLKDQAAAAGRELPPDLEVRLKDSIVLDEMIIQEGERRGFAKSAEFTAELEQFRREFISKKLREIILADRKISDQQILDEYSQLKAKAEPFEYRIRHIIVDRAVIADDLFDRIKKGESFADLAKRYSLNEASAANGGLLDYSGKNDYLPEFSAQLDKLSVGQMSEKPFKTSVGWHIIKLEDKRERKFPEFDQVKNALRGELERRAYADYLRELRKTSVTDYKFSGG